LLVLVLFGDWLEEIGRLNLHLHEIFVMLMIIDLVVVDIVKSFISDDNQLFVHLDWLGSCIELRGSIKIMLIVGHLRGCSW
jgi:hypothetical protein